MTWDVAATVNEADALVLAFAAHHLDLGARRVHLFLDHPQPSLARALSASPSVRVTVTDARWWAVHGPNGLRPPKQGPRQMANLQSVLDDADAAAWVFHLDGDEFLDLGEDVGGALARQRDATAFVPVPAVERVHLGAPDPRNVLAGAFRRPAPPEHEAAAARADGAAAPYLIAGVTGYAAGKSAFRTGMGLLAGIHCPTRPDRKSAGRLPGRARLLHFDGLTPDHYVAKRLRLLSQQPGAVRNEAPPRARQLERMREIADDPQALQAFYALLKCLSPERAAALRDLGLLEEARFDPRPAIARHFPGATADLSQQAIDGFAIGPRPEPQVQAAPLWRRLLRKGPSAT